MVPGQLMALCGLGVQGVRVLVCVVAKGDGAGEKVNLPKSAMGKLAVD